MNTVSATMTKSVLLSARKLSVGYTHKHSSNILLHGLNIDIYAGELVCFMGPNGIGKSSLIRTLAGLQDPLEGQVQLALQSENNKRPQPPSISVVLTDRITAVNMTVEDLVTYGRYPYVDWNIRLNTEDKEAVDKAIDLTHISSLRRKRLYELSDGQMQMAMIARALAQDTPLILLDEPTAHLDLNNRVEIMNLLRHLAQTTGKGILVATHELDLALQTADRIWLAGRNKNIQTGIPEDLVLDGSFDDIFQLKGFDLKTGKVFQEPWRKIAVRLVGEGHAYLWTKNALERCGYEVNNESVLQIEIAQKGYRPEWRLQNQSFSRLAELVRSLEEKF